MEDPGDRPSINLEEFRFVTFKSKSGDRRKIARKRHLLNITIKEVYPPEGHLLFSRGPGQEILLSSDESSEGETSGSDENSEADENMSSCYIIGGARNSEESTWQFADGFIHLSSISQRVTSGLKTQFLSQLQNFLVLLFLGCHISLALYLNQIDVKT